MTEITCVIVMFVCIVIYAWTDTNEKWNKQYGNKRR